MSLPVASSAPSRGRDETLFNWSVPPPCRAGRRHRQNRQSSSAGLTLLKLVRSRSNEITECAQVRTCCVVAARGAPLCRAVAKRRRVTACAECALPLEEKTSLLAPQIWKRWAREWKKFAASREARRRRLAPPLGNRGERPRFFAHHFPHATSRVVPGKDGF